MVNSINLGEYWYCMNRIAWWLIKNNKQFKKRDLYGYGGKVVDLKTMETAIRDRGDNVELDGLVAEFVECAIFDNSTNLSFLPNYVVCSDRKTKLYADTYVDMANRVSAYEVLNGQSPRIVYLKKENTTNNSALAVLNEFEKHFGICKTIDDALYAIWNKGYAFYFDSQYDTVKTIERVDDGDGSNCTDISQVFYRLAYGINEKYGAHYEVKFVHVRCKSGTGHVRLMLRNGGNWFYRDPAAVLDGESVSHNWCSDGTIIAYNPSWIFTDLYK